MPHPALIADHYINKQIDKIRDIIMNVLFLDHAENERELRCYNDITDKEIQKCILALEQEFGIFISKGAPDFIIVEDMIDAIKIKLSE